jgi:hypothetical protein
MASNRNTSIFAEVIMNFRIQWSIMQERMTNKTIQLEEDLTNHIHNTKGQEQRGL